MKKNANFYLRTAAMLGMAVVMCCSAALLNSCKEDDENTDDPKVTPSLAVSATTLPVAATGGTATFTVTTNVAWTVATTADFVDLSPTSGATTTVVTATVDENTSTEPRTATITVSGEGVAAQTVTVAQGGASAPPLPTFEVSPTTLEVLPIPASGFVTITVTTEEDITWTAVGTAKNMNEGQTMGFFGYVWEIIDGVVQPAPGDGASYTSTGSGTFSVYTGRNEGMVPRSGTVTVASTDGMFSEVITLTQNPFPKISVSPLELHDAPKAGTTAPVLVLSSTSWTASGTGVSVSPTSGTGGTNESFTVTIAPNSGSTELTGSITVTAGEFTFTIPVSQRGVEPAEMEYIELNGLKWAKYNQGFAGVIPSKVTYGGVFQENKIAENLCPTGWRLPALSEWVTGNLPVRSVESSVNGFYMDGKENSPTLATYPFIPFVNYEPGVSTITYQTTGFSGTPNGDIKVQTMYATSNAIANLQEAIRINPWDDGGEHAPHQFWFGQNWGDGVPMGNAYGYHVRCVKSE
jgi:hypothetical protein